MTKTILSEFYFWTHIPFLVAWFLPFFISRSVWPGKLSFQFWFMFIVLCINYVWGLMFLLVIKKYVMACPWTTVTQLHRGHSLHDPKNHYHSFVSEMSDRLGIKISKVFVTCVMLGTFFLVTVQYFVMR